MREAPVVRQRRRRDGRRAAGIEDVARRHLEARLRRVRRRLEVRSGITVVRDGLQRIERDDRDGNLVVRVGHLRRIGEAVPRAAERVRLVRVLEPAVTPVLLRPRR